MSAYNQNGVIDLLEMTVTEWNIFLNVIQVDCRFSRKLMEPYRRFWPICPSGVLIHVKFYMKDGTQHMHVSNEDRRKIVDYLRSMGSITNKMKPNQ